MLDIQPVDRERRFPEVDQLTQNDLRDPETRRTLYDLWIQHGVLVFRDGKSDPEIQLELSRIFGEPTLHPFKERLVEGHPYLLWVRHIPGQEVVYDVDGELLGGWLPWHSDLAYMAEINRGGILRAIELPEHGGLTGFIDQIEVYAALPEPLKQRIEGLNVVYRLELDAAQQKFGRYPGLGRRQAVSDSVKSIDARAATDFPDVVHPLVYVQKETGRKVLNLSPWFADRILELPGADGDRLLSELADYCVDERRAYYHRWRPGDMVLWDNWRVLHRATGVAPTAVRKLQRTTLAGDYQLGRVLQRGSVARGQKVDV